MKKIVLALIILLASCQTYKTKFVKDDEDTNIDKLDRVYAKANYLKKDELWLVFYTGYKHTHIVVSENEIVKFDSIIASKEAYPYITKVLKVNKKALINIQFDSIKKPLLITKDEMYNYKSIYITKKASKFQIEFNNGNKPRIDYIKANQKKWNRQAKIAIRDSIKRNKEIK